MPDDATRKMMYRWLTGSVYAAIKLVGNRTMKVFTRGMSMVFVNSINREYGEPLVDGLGIEETVNGFKDLEVLSSQTENGSVEYELSENEMKMVFKGCVYADLCNDLIPSLTGTGEFSEKTIPCLRCSNYSAALALFNKSRWPYHLVQYAPGAKCTGVLKKL
jgi:hypothetical protein